MIDHLDRFCRSEFETIQIHFLASAILSTILNVDAAKVYNRSPYALITEDDWSAEDHGPALGCE